MGVRKLLGIAVLCLAVVGCSTTDEIDFTGQRPKDPTTTVDPLDGVASTAGAAGVAELRLLVDRLVASGDVCAILTQRDVAQNKLDPTIFTSAAARRVLASGLVKVFDHLLVISDPVILPSLQAEKDVFAKVLDVVDRYSNNPGSAGATSEINSLVDSPGFLTAQQQLNLWITANCR